MNSRPTSRSHAIILAFMIVSMTSYAARLTAGDVEKVCTGGTEHDEFWFGFTPPLAWKLHVSAGATLLGPYFPGAPKNNCTGSLTQTTPGMQSAIQGILEWNYATIPGTSPGVLGSVFTFDDTSTPTTGTSPVSQTDNLNEIDMYPPPHWFSQNGFSGALSITRVSIDPLHPNTGHIVDADIVINTTQVMQANTSVVLWSFLENNTLYGQWIVSDTTNNGSAAPTPNFGFVDLQGDVTHELGHAAGLGHSVIDSSASSSGTGFPTMFPFAQAEPLASTFVYKYAACAAIFSGNISGTIIGRSAQTLAYDDLVAIARRYPSSGFGTLGTITGTVKDSSGTPILGAVVVAVPSSPSATAIEAPRIQTLSYSGGVYSLDGLTAGSYYVYIEPVDQDPSGLGGPGYYFGNFGDVPNYVDLTGNGGCASHVAFQTEYYNSSDQSAEVQCAASVISVASGATVNNVNFVVSLNQDILTVGVVTGGVSPAYHSPRGVRFTLPTGGSGSKTVEFSIHAGAAYAGYAYRVQFSEVRTTNLVSTFGNPVQIDQIIQTANSSYPPTLGGTLDGSGNAVFQYTFGSALRFDMVFAQADVGPVGAEAYSNCTEIWVAQ